MTLAQEGVGRNVWKRREREVDRTGLGRDVEITN
jgi:hypothetical protein